MKILIRMCGEGNCDNRVVRSARAVGIAAGK
jgi:hypothetical protein